MTTQKTTEFTTLKGTPVTVTASRWESTGNLSDISADIGGINIRIETPADEPRPFYVFIEGEESTDSPQYPQIADAIRVLALYLKKVMVEKRISKFREFESQFN